MGKTDEISTELSDESSPESNNSETPATNQKILENWEKHASDIFIRLFFSREKPDDVEIVDDICQHVLLSQKEGGEEFVKTAIENGFIDVIARNLQAIDELPDFSDLDCLLRITIICTDISPVFCKAAVSKKVPKFVIQSLQSPIFDQLDDSEMVTNFREQMLTVLYNILRHLPEEKQKLRENGVIDVALTHLKSDEPTIKTLALFVISFAADISANKELIKATSSSIKFILESCLTAAMESVDHEGDDGWSVAEVLSALSLLSQNSENAVEMVNLGLLDNCEKLLEEEFCELEVGCCLDILWSMTFLEDLRARIKKCDKILARVEKFKNHKDEKIVKSATGIKWNLKHLDEAGKPSEKVSKGNHIMISYCWAQKSQAWHIKEKLNQSGIEVWIDTKDMEGDVFDAMTAAVENASHVICCISEDYTSSRFCRLEAVNAWMKKKPLVFARVQKDYQVNGWLQFLMSGAFYYEMHCRDEIEQNFQRCFAYLEGNPVSEEISSQEARLTEESPVTEKRLVQTLECSNWSKEEVIKWFESIGCSSKPQKEDFWQAMNGKLLEELCSWKKTAPEFFLKSVKEELGFDLLDLLKFSNAVANLSQK